MPGVKVQHKTARGRRKIAAAKRKLGKAAKLREEAKKYKGKKAGAMRATAARKEKRAGIKRGKAGVQMSAKAIKKEAQKEFGRRGAKVMKLVGKAESLEGSPRRQKTRRKHLTKRINRITKRIKK